MSEFLHTIPLVNRGIKIRCKELHYYTYKNFVKTVLNDSDEDLDYFITDFLKENITNYDIGDLDVIDKFIIIAYIRCVNVSSDVSLESTCTETEKKYNVDIDLIDILDRIDSLDLQKTSAASYGDLTINFQLPRSFINDTIFDLCASSIDTVYYNNQKIDLDIHEYDIDRTKLLKGIPAQALTHYRNFLADQNEKLSDFKMFNITSPHISGGSPSQFRLSFYTKNMLKFIKFMYQDDFKSLYDLEYQMYSTNNLPYDVIKNSTFMEMQIFNNCGKRPEQQLPEAPPSIGKSLPEPIS